MARVFITATDEGDGVDIVVTFDPPLRPHDPMTPAQEAALAMTGFYRQENGGEVVSRNGRPVR